MQRHDSVDDRRSIRPFGRAHRGKRARSGGRRFAVLLLAGTALAGVVPIVFGATVRPEPGQRIDLKVLLMTATGAESGFGAWKAVLDRAGVPYDAVVADSSPAFTDATFADYAAERARYQAVILTDGDLVRADSSPTLVQSEWDALAKFTRTFGIRQISDLTLPSPARGLQFATHVGEQGGQTGQVTGAGATVFPELQGPVPIDPGSFGYRAEPLAGANFTTLVSGPAGSSYVGVFTHADGREELVITVASSQFHLQNQLLRRGLINWVTRGVHLGYERNYFTMHIDDVFAADAAWDPVSNTTPEEATPPTCGGPSQPACVSHRMSPGDTAATRAWQQANGIVFDLAYNGAGVGEARAAGGGVDPLSDDPVNGLLLPGVIDDFRWINHTWSHPNLDTTPQQAFIDEVTLNAQFAAANSIPIDATELVTGEHSGLGTYTAFGGNPANPNLGAVLAATGIAWVGDDNSAQPVQRALPTPPASGVALTVPRHPSNVYFNVASRDDQLDEYNHIYLPPPAGQCVNTSVTTCRSTAATWSDYTASEADIMFDHVMGNDPRPHYAHQSNLMVPGGNGILLGPDGQGVLDVLLARYSTYVKREAAPLVQPTMADAGALIRQQSRWLAEAPSVTAYLRDGQVHISTAGSVDVPLTGTAVGGPYSGQRSGWVTVSGSAQFAPADPASVAPPVIAGGATVGDTLTVTAGVWTGTGPITVVRRWQRCQANGSSCATITSNGDPVTGATYVTTGSDVGFRIRVAELASGPVSSVSQATSTATAVVARPSLPGPPAPSPPPVQAPVPAQPTVTGPAVAAAATVTVRALRMTSRRFATVRAAERSPRRLGTTITWRLDVPARTTFVVQRRSGKRWATVGSLARPGRVGLNTWRFAGVAGKRALRPGSYRIVAIARATPAAGSVRSAPVALTFTVVR